MKLFSFIFALSLAAKSKLENLSKRLEPEQRNLSKKPLILSNEMLMAYLVENNIDEGNYDKIAYSAQKPLDYQGEERRKGSKPIYQALLDVEDEEEELTFKANKGGGVEDRWRMRLTNCQKKNSCQCGGSFEATPNTEGMILSQDELNYKPNMNCIWTITAPEDYTILARFEKFAIEREDVCGFDYVMLFTGQMRYLHQQSHNDTVRSEGVFCGSIKYPQNVGNDDWSDKTALIPTADSGDDTLNRTMFNGQWVDLESRNAGIIMVTDSDTQHAGFALQYKAVPKNNAEVNITTVYDMLEFIHENMLEHIRTNPLNTPELVLLQEHHVNKTIARLHRATTKKCYDLKDDQIPTKIQNNVKTTKTITGYFDPLLDFVVVTHKNCRSKHRYAWRKRFNKLGTFISEATASIQMQRKINRHQERGVGFFATDLAEQMF